MKGHELAKELGVESSDVSQVLGDKHHMVELTDDEIATVVAHFEGLAGSEEGGEEEKPPVEQPPVGPEVLRIVSRVQKHTFILRGQNVSFEDYCMRVHKDGEAHRALKAIHDTDMMLVRNEPFESHMDRTVFREMLEDMVITGAHEEVSVGRGLAFLGAFFEREEQPEVAKTLHEGGAKALIELAVIRKSWEQLQA